MIFVEAILRTAVSSAGLGLIFAIPIFVILLMLQRQKKAYRAAAHEPFTKLPLRPPGESLRLKLEELSEEIDSQFVMLVLCGAVCSTAVFNSNEKSRMFVAGVTLPFVVAIGIWSGRKLCRLARRRWDYHLGFTGERIVGEELNQLLAEGFRVFHDVPFDGFNVDHILVGAAGLYVVETKSRRKPADIKGSGRAVVTFDGVALHFPRFSDTRSLEQVRRNARTVEAWLSKATGESIVAEAILTLPGWFVSRRAVSDVKVLNPDEIKHSFPNRPKQPLSPAQIQRISHQLSERCRLAPAT